MAFEVASTILKTHMKNTIFKKGFQGKDAKPEEIKRFSWLNLDNSLKIENADELYSFMQQHPFSVMLPSEDSILPDLVSAINGEIVFISEYPKLAKQFEPIFIEFTQKYISTGKIFEYPLLQSANVLIESDMFRILYHLKSNKYEPDEHAQKIIKFILENGAKSKREIRDNFREDKYVFARIDFYLYQLVTAFQLYKISFDQIDGNIYDILTRFSPYLKEKPANQESLALILESMIQSSLYINPIELQRGLKKLFTKEEVMIALSDLEQSGKIGKVKINKQNVLVHKETFEKTNI